jgi:hypothetical protein
MISTDAKQAISAVLFSDESVLASSEAQVTGYHPKDSFLTSLHAGLRDNLFLTQWRLISYMPHNKNISSLPYETSEFLVQKSLTSKKLLTRHFTQVSSSLEASPFTVYSADKGFVKQFEELVFSGTKIPSKRETATRSKDNSNGFLMFKCSECGALNFDPKDSPKSPYKDQCMKCLREFKG